MATYNYIIQTISEYLEKCHTSIAEMHQLLDNWTEQEKRILLKYSGIDFDEGHYDDLLLLGSDEEIFEYERQIFDTFKGKTRRDNLLEYCTDFNEKEYREDEDVGYPSTDRGELEYNQEQIQEKQGYDDKIITAIREDWTGGYYNKIQDYLLGNSTKKELIENYGDETGNRIVSSADEIMKYIDGSQGLAEDTVLYRGGYWEEGVKVGTVGEIPCLNSTSFSKQTAREVGIMGSSEKYMLTVYSPKGTKGCMVNAPSLRNEFGGHEYLLNKGQKYIVLAVDDVEKTATIKLINE